MGTTTKRITLKAINKALADKGYKVELFKGDNYFYFFGPDAANFEEQGVYTYHLSNLTIDEWVLEFEEKKKYYGK